MADSGGTERGGRFGARAQGRRGWRARISKGVNDANTSPPLTPPAPPCRALTTMRSRAPWGTLRLMPTPAARMPGTPLPPSRRAMSAISRTLTSAGMLAVGVLGPEGLCGPAWTRALMLQLLAWRWGWGGVGRGRGRRVQGGRLMRALPVCGLSQPCLGRPRSPCLSRSHRTGCKRSAGSGELFA